MSDLGPLGGGRSLLGQWNPGSLCTYIRISMADAWWAQWFGIGRGNGVCRAVFGWNHSSICRGQFPLSPWNGSFLLNVYVRFACFAKVLMVSFVLINSSAFVVKSKILTGILQANLTMNGLWGHIPPSRVGNTTCSSRSSSVSFSWLNLAIKSFKDSRSPCLIVSKYATGLCHQRLPIKWDRKLLPSWAKELTQCGGR